MKHLLSYFKSYIKESILAPLFKLLEAVFAVSYTHLRAHET